MIFCKNKKTKKKNKQKDKKKQKKKTTGNKQNTTKQMVGIS